MRNLEKLCRILIMAASICLWSGASFAVSDCSPACSSGYNCVCKADGTCGCVKNQSSSSGTSTPTNSKVDTSVGTSTTQSESAITGCSSDYGLFSGLIETGKKVFNGLRDLIYVVAGFGIIGVAVGGFFGNLNWKWLGAILIALVVIASTGEIINMITGCEEFTQAMIVDTIK